MVLAKNKKTANIHKFIFLTPIMKMKTKIIIGLLLFVFGGINFSLAQNSNNNNGEVADFDVKNAMTDVQALKKNLDELIDELYSLDEQERWTNNSISDKYRATRGEIVKVIQTINTTTDTITEQLKKIETYKKLMVITYKELQASRSGMVDTKQHIEDFVNFIYKLDNKLYNENTNSIDEIKLLINSDNVPLTLANNHLVQSMVIQINDLMNSFQVNEKKQLETMKKLNQLKSEAKASIGQYQNEIEQLQQKKNYLLQFMKLYQNDTTQKQITIDTFFESTKDVYTKIIELIHDSKRWVYKVDFDMEKKLEKLNKTTNNNAYPLAWPIYPIESIQTYFWDEQYQKQHGVPHMGIQIKAEQRTPVYAARDGIVYFVAENDHIAINWIMIAHTDWYISVYQYLNEHIVQAGDEVKKGQIIWYSWGEPGTRGAGFISQWANLSFSIFKDWIARDPFEILDTSIVQDKQVLPEGYQIKYLRDKYARTIDITDLELMTGDTHIKRQVQFLSKFWIGTYRNIAFRENVVKETNIDTDMVICVAFAESTLGRHLSTSNNIGNVGNNDRWDRVWFTSAYGGARAIAVTLNNSALGKYHTINQLSRYGNKDGMIYASSPINRQTNVLKCLSQIKWYYVPEDFPFRTGPNPNINNPIPEKVEFGESLSK